MYKEREDWEMSKWVREGQMAKAVGEELTGRCESGATEKGRAIQELSAQGQ